MASDFFRGDIGRLIGQAGPAIGAGAGFLMGGPVGAGIGMQAGAGISGMYGAEQANAQTQENTQQANVMSQTNAREQMDFQREMSNTAHQRQVADLKAAGLNPILSVNSGSSSPSGSQGSVNTAQVANTMEGLSATARDISQFTMNMQKQKEELKLLQAQKRKTDVDSLVATKGIPEAEARNTVWGFLKDLFKKTEDRNESPNLKYKERQSPKWKKRANDVFNSANPFTYNKP